MGGSIEEGQVGYLRHIRLCNKYDLGGFRRFVAAGQPVGWVRHAAARRLSDWPFFEVGADTVTLTDRLDSYAARSEAVAGAVMDLAASGDVPALCNEAFPVRTEATAAPLLQVDRSAVTFFGVVSYGVHLNGFVRNDNSTSFGSGDGRSRCGSSQANLTTLPRAANRLDSATKRTW